MNLKIKLCIAIIFAFLFGFIAYAGYKFPSYVGYVNDFANVIGPINKGRIGSLAKSLKQKTGAELAVVTIKSSSPLDSKTYAVELFKEWGIGEKGKDNGILILAAIDDRRVEIEVGYGLEGIITDGFSGRVLDEKLVPYFKKGEYGQGLYETALVIAEKIEKEYDPKAPVTRHNKMFESIILWALILFYVIAFIISFRTGGKKNNVIFGSFLGAILGFVFAGIFGLFFGAVFGAIIANNGYYYYGGGMYGGGFGGGSFSGGGFGGFSGGASGGGGAGRSW